MARDESPEDKAARERLDKALADDIERHKKLADKLRKQIDGKKKA